MAKDDPDKAIAEFRKALEGNLYERPAVAAAHIGLSGAMEKKGLVKEAAEEFRQGCQIDPSIHPDCGRLTKNR